jgi:hypothetical protein
MEVFAFINNLCSGLLFEAYILRLGKNRDVTLLHHHLQHGVKMSEANKKREISIYTIPFWFYLVTAIQKVAPSVGSLLFIWTLCLEFYGISRFGINLLAQSSVAQSIRTYDRWRLEYLKKYDQKLLQMIESNQGLLLYDNYNHQYGNPKLDLERKEQMSLANYTVGAFSRYVAQVDFSLKTYNGHVLLSLPTEKKNLHKYLNVFVQGLIREYNSLKQRTGKPFDYFSVSVMARERRLRVPIAEVPSPNQDNQDPLERKENGLKNFYPWFVTKYNSAQNEGHANIMLKLLSTCRKILALGFYPFVRMDITLYMQWLRVLLSYCYFSYLF